jgi:lysophospholipase L1-like esterase
MTVVVGLGVFVAPTAAIASPTHASTPSYYISLGDSLAEGLQPPPAVDTNGSETLHGYSDQVVTDVASKIKLTLVNLGCGGATTTSILTSVGCKGGEANNAPPYPSETQAGAALSFISAHPGQVKLISISIGANDYANCLNLASPVSCVAAAMRTMESNIKTLAGQLRAAVGPSVAIVAVTDVDSDIVHWLHGGASGKASAKQWIAEFRNIITPTLAAGYAPSKVTLVNIFADFDTYVPLIKLVKCAPYGKIPFAVARECQLTWICVTNNGNQHPTSAGYALMAKEITKAYLKLLG